jgi:hypothetical protein
MNITRTDEHRPSAIIPSNYEYVAVDYTRGDYSDNLRCCDSQRNIFKAHQQKTGGHILHEEGSPCDVCGSPRLVYGLLFHHAPSNVYVRVGEDCAYKLGLGGSAQFNAFKRDLKAQVEVYAGKAKAQKILAESGLSRAWEIAMTNTHGYEENIIRDIVSKLVRYGSISVNQGAFIGKLLAKMDARAVVAAQRKAENEAAADFPVTEARVQVTGTIVSTKLQESDFGTVLKMLVKAEEGYKVWVTCPAQGEGHKGSKVRFFAKLQPSRDDPKFGFGSRPTKFEIIQTAEVVAA